MIQYGAVPVFVDVTVPQYNIDVSQLEAALSEKTKAVMRNLAESGADVVELGVLRDSGYRKGHTDYYATSIIKDCPPKRSNRFSLLVDTAKPFTTEYIEPASKSCIDLFRVVLWEDAVDEGLRCCKVLKEKGYEVSVLLVNCGQYSPQKFSKMAELAVQIDPVSIYVDDCYGMLYAEQIIEELHLLDEMLTPQVAIGYSGANSLQQVNVAARSIICDQKFKHDCILDVSAHGYLDTQQQKYAKKNEDLFWLTLAECSGGKRRSMRQMQRDFFANLPKDDEAIKNVQIVIREILQGFAAICERNGLTYWLSCGTLLGAVRGSGFIPWDDDGDICMPRADFERFEQIIQDDPDFQLAYYYIVGYPDGPARMAKLQLRNAGFSVFLDIFPCDDTTCSMGNNALKVVEEQSAEPLEMRVSCFKAEIGNLSNLRSHLSLVFECIGFLQLGFYKIKGGDEFVLLEQRFVLIELTALLRHRLALEHL